MVLFMFVSILLSLTGISLAGIVRADRISLFLTARGWLRCSPPVVAACSLITLFIGLTAVGFTGSSLKTGLDKSTFISHDLIKLIGKSRPVRSDEAIVYTPMAIGQSNVEPRFPVVNRNIGIQGQNMLVPGMTGVPVRHLSSLARPATWGFYFLGLRQALAWYWWFPVFACLLALWWLLELVFPGKWRYTLALSGLFTFSPYAVGWSFWPAYVVFFPALAMSIMLTSLKLRSIVSLLMLSLPLGLSLAGFFLILYPPWQVSVGYLFMFFFVGVVVRDRLHDHYAWRHALMLMVALAITGLLLASWWLDAHDAVEAIRQTVYPGKRAAVVGGDGELLFWVKGVSNLVTMHKTFNYLNASEMSSFIHVLPPLIVGLLIGVRSKRDFDPVVLALLLYVLVSVTYYFVGFPVVLAKATLWGRCTGGRTDLSLGLAQICLIANVLTSKRFSTQGEVSVPLRSIRHVVPAAWAVILVIAFVQLSAHFESFEGRTRLLVWVVVLTGIAINGLIVHYLFSGKRRAFFTLYGLLTLLIVVPFNPVVLAPSRFTTVSGFPAGVEDRGRVLFLDGGALHAMMLMAAGRPVLNGVYYYPQFQIWRRLDATGSKMDLYNRYQHFMFDAEPLPEGYPARIENPRPDVVRVTVDGRRFDFRSLPVDYVVTTGSVFPHLEGNPSVFRRGERNEWDIWQVRQ